MPATYSFDPSLGSAQDRARSRISDYKAPWILSDEEVADHLASEPTFLLACANMAETCAARLSRLPVEQGENEGEVYKWSERVSGFRALAKALRAEASAANVTTGTRIRRIATTGIERLKGL